MRAVIKFIRQPAAQKLLTLEATVTVIGVVVVLRLLPYSRWRDALSSAPAAANPSPATVAKARQVGQAVSAVARNLPGRPQCLAQALAARAMLKRRGIASELNLGVNKDRAAINAHAWLAVGRQIVTGGPDVSAFSAFGKPV